MKSKKDIFYLGYMRGISDVGNIFINELQKRGVSKLYITSESMLQCIKTIRGLIVKMRDNGFIRYNLDKDKFEFDEDI